MTETEPIYLLERDGFTLKLYDTGRTDSYGKTVLSYRLLDGEDLIFAGDDFHASPLHAIDSDATAAGLLVFLSLKPGDTDAEYFDAYTPRQLRWVDERADDLQMIQLELEETP